MNILVTGATGFLGSRTVEMLADKPEVEKILATGRNTAFVPQKHSPKVKYKFGDLSNEDFVSQLFESPIDYVINCASLSSPWGDYEVFYRSNVLSQKWLIDTSQHHNIKRFVYISTPGIYFDFTDHFQLTEDHPIPSKPVNHYAATKLQAEKLIDKSGLEYVTLRPRALIGRGDTVIMPRLIRAHQEGRLRIMGEGNNIADLTPVSNMTDAIWSAVIAERAHCNQAYNIANGDPVVLWQAINDILDQLDLKPIDKKIPYQLLMGIARVMEWKARWLNGSKEPTLTRYSVAVLARSFTFDISKARQNLGFEPRQSIEEAIREFVSWYKYQLK